MNRQGDDGAKATLNTVDEVNETVKAAVADVADSVEEAVTQVGDATTAFARLRAAYNSNPVRFVTVGVIVLAGLVAIISVLARRS